MLAPRDGALTVSPRVHLTDGLLKITAGQVVRVGFGLTIQCTHCGHHARWTCREVFDHLHKYAEAPLFDACQQLRCLCADPLLSVDWWRDLRAYGGVRPEET